MATVKPQKKVQPVAAKVEPSPEVPAKVVESEEPTKQKDIHIAPARVRRGLDNEGLNAEINKELAPHKVIISRHKYLSTCLEQGKLLEFVKEDEEKKSVARVSRALTPEEVTSYGAEVATLVPKLPAAEHMISILSHEKTRFANHAAPTLAAVCERIVIELLENSISVIHSSEMKIINVKHLFTSEANLPLKQLYQDLPLYKSKKEFYVTEARTKEFKKELEATVAAAKKDWCKEKSVPVDAKRKVDGTKPPKSTPAQKPKEIADAKLTFKVYVGHIIEDLKKVEQNKSVRFSDEVRNFLSNLLNEFIARIATIVHLYIESKKNKTVNAPVIMRAVQVLLVDGHAPRETIEYRKEMCVDPTTKKPEMKVAAIKELPKTLQTVVNKKKDYPTSGYGELQAFVLDKLRKFYADDPKVDVDKLGL